MYQKERGTRVLFLLLAIWTAFLVFSCPQVCEEAISGGLKLCGGTLFLSLFPFLIVSSLLMYCEIGKGLSFIFHPVAKWMGIEGEMGERILLIGLLGGFASAAQAVKSAVQKGKLTPQKASLVLSAAVLPSPSFIILTVGYSLLNDKVLGEKLFLSQVLGNYLATAIVFAIKRMWKNGTTAKGSSDKISHPSEPNESPSAIPSLSRIISDCTVTYLKLCGIILYFRLLCKGMQAFLPAGAYAVSAMLLEVSAGCEQASRMGSGAAFWCDVALSIQGISAISQIRMICPNEVSLKPMLLSKAFQIPLSLLILRFLLLFGTDRAVYSSLEGVRQVGWRIPTDCALLVFVGCCIMAYQASQALRLDEK